MYQILRKKVVSETEIRTLEKGLHFAPIQNKINQPELSRNFKEFCRHICLDLNFRNEATPEFSYRPAFSSKSSWNQPTGHPNLKVFLSQIEHKLLQIPDVYLIPTFLRSNGRLLNHWKKINLLLLKSQTKCFMCSGLG